MCFGRYGCGHDPAGGLVCLILPLGRSLIWCLLSLERNAKGCCCSCLIYFPVMSTSEISQPDLQPIRSIRELLYKQRSRVTRISPTSQLSSPVHIRPSNIVTATGLSFVNDNIFDWRFLSVYLFAYLSICLSVCLCLCYPICLCETPFKSA